MPGRWGFLKEGTFRVEPSEALVSCLTLVSFKNVLRMGFKFWSGTFSYLNSLHASRPTVEEASRCRDISVRYCALIFKKVVLAHDGMPWRGTRFSFSNMCYFSFKERVYYLVPFNGPGTCRFHGVSCIIFFLRKWTDFSRFGVSAKRECFDLEEQV